MNSLKRQQERIEIRNWKKQCSAGVQVALVFGSADDRSGASGESQWPPAHDEHLAKLVKRDSAKLVSS